VTTGHCDAASICCRSNKRNPQVTLSGDYTKNPLSGRHRPSHGRRLHQLWPALHQGGVLSAMEMFHKLRVRGVVFLNNAICDIGFWLCGGCFF